MRCYNFHSSPALWTFRVKIDVLTKVSCAFFQLDDHAARETKGGAVDTHLSIAILPLHLIKAFFHSSSIIISIVRKSLMMNGRTYKNFLSQRSSARIANDCCANLRSFRSVLRKMTINFRRLVFISIIYGDFDCTFACPLRLQLLLCHQWRWYLSGSFKN